MRKKTIEHRWFVIAFCGTLATCSILVAAGPDIMPFMWRHQKAPVLASAVDQQLVIKIAPQRLLLSDVQSGTVVVHAEIDYDVVDTASVLLEGVPALHTKADLRGELVAYFDEAAIKALVSPPRATLTLTGTTIDGTAFSGSDTVKVKS